MKPDAEKALETIATRLTDLKLQGSTLEQRLSNITAEQAKQTALLERIAKALEAGQKK